MGNYLTPPKSSAIHFRKNWIWGTTPDGTRTYILESPKCCYAAPVDRPGIKNVFINCIALCYGDLRDAERRFQAIFGYPCTISVIERLADNK